MARWGMAAGLAALLSAGAAAAQDSGDDRDDRGGGFSLTVENDMFVPHDDTDRYYTHGMKASWLLSRDHDGLLAGVVRRLGSAAPGAGLGGDWRVRATLGVGQHMYTPEDKSLTTPDPADRPYAGWLYVATSSFIYTPQQMVGVELQVGMVGPDAHAGPLQNQWHVWINAPPINGWASELNNEMGVNLHTEYRRRFVRGNPEGVGADAILIGTAAFGNVEVSAGAGAIVRWGFNLRDDWGPSRLRPAATGTEFFGGDRFAAYVFAGAYGRVVARDIFLDGNTFEDSASVDREIFVPEYTWGAAIRSPRARLWRDWYWPATRFGYTYIERGDEFVGQLAPSRFGVFSISFVRNGLRSWW